MLALRRPMRSGLAIAALAIIIAGCGGPGGIMHKGTAPDAVVTPPHLPPRIPVPYVLGERPAKAVADLEAVGFVGTVQGNPDQPELCRVRDQDPMGTATRGATVLLSLRC